MIVHTDNRTVAYGLARRTLRGVSMEVLRQCLLLATDQDLDLEVEWIPTKANAQANALSRFDLDKITDLAPQVIHPICNLQMGGWQTYSSQDFRQLPPTTSGAVLHYPHSGTTTLQVPGSRFSTGSPTTATSREDAFPQRLLG